MAWFVRKVRWNRWQERINDADIPFTAISPDPLGDVSTAGKTLSLWKLDDERKNLERVIALLAATMQAPAECAFIIFPADRINDLDLYATQINGNSPDAAANIKWHFDVVVPSAAHLLTLARLLLHQGELGRKNIAEVKALLRVGIEKNELDLNKMDSRFREKLGLGQSGPQ